MDTGRDRLKNRIYDLTCRYQARGYFPSAVVRVFNQRETLAAIAVGEATVDSVFDVASLTKIATATQILRLILEGKIGLRDTVSDRFPEIQANDYLRERLRGVTLYQLLTHTSTIPAWYPFYSRRGEDFFDVFAYALRHTPPADGMVYSDLNFMLLGILISRVQGKPLKQCLTEDLALPLSLGVMGYQPDPSLPLVPSCYGNDIEMRMCQERGISFDGFRPLGVPVKGEVNDGNCHYYFSGISGHAGIFATAEAYQKLCQYYMNSDIPLLLDAQTEQKSAPGRGIGFQTGGSYPYGCGHTGFTGTSIYFSSAYHLGVVAFTNRLYFPEGSKENLSEFRRALHEAVFALLA